MNTFELSKLCSLFQGMEEQEIKHVLQCLQVEEKQYQKNEILARPGEIITKIGIVISGSVHIVKDDFWGNRTIITNLQKGQLFGESYACSLHEPLEVTIIASENVTILYAYIQRILTTCEKQCPFHYRLLENVLSNLATKNLLLTRKIEHLTKRNTREKILSYLSELSIKNNSTSFIVPFNRQQLADFLSIDRSAMSKELSKMQKEGILTIEKNTFYLLTDTSTI